MKKKQGTGGGGSVVLVRAAPPWFLMSLWALSGCGSGSETDDAAGSAGQSGAGGSAGAGGGSNRACRRPGVDCPLQSRGIAMWALPLIGANYMHATRIAASPAALIAVGQFDQALRLGAAGPTLTAEAGRRVFMVKVGP